MICRRTWLVSLAAVGSLFLASVAHAQAEEETTEESVEAPEAQEESTEAAAVPAVAPEGSSNEHAAESQLAQQIRAREEIASIHRAFGIATWVSMALTAVFGWIQFADEYGFHGNATQTACANNSAVFQDFCSPNPPWIHMIAGFTTAALYITTATISFLIPEPVGVNADVELHKTLRWFHMATFLATAVLGIVTANIETDFETQQALAITHQSFGVVTFGLLTTAAAVVLF